MDIKPGEQNGSRLSRQAFFRRTLVGTEETATPSHAIQTPTNSAKNNKPEKVATALPQEVGSEFIYDINNINNYEHEFETRPRPSVGGRLQQFYGRWAEITSDPFILSAIQGYEIEFEENCIPPNRSKPYFQFKRSQKEFDDINTEIDNLLAKNVIETCDHQEGEFLSNIFTRPKKNGGVRVILDLTELNKNLKVQHFKMDTIHTAAQLITKGSFLASVDLRDAYYSVPIHSDHRKYLRFIWHNQRYQFKALPNGLSTAPRLFTKILKPVFATLREAGHTVIGYLDDTIIIGQSKAKAEQAVIATTEILSELGFIVHDEKSVLEPTQVLQFLGFKLNTLEFTITVPDDKAQDVVQKCENLMNNTKPSIREVAQVIGKIVAAFPAAQYGPLYYRNLETEKIAALKANSGHFDRTMRLSDNAKKELQWWIVNIGVCCAPIGRETPPVEIRTDASGAGWGATDLTTNTGGRWNESENEKAKNNKINYLELRAVDLGLKSFCTEMRNVHILVRVDNITAVTYLNNMGGVRSQDCNLMATKIWRWCIHRNIWLTASYLPGKLNTEADQKSRKFNDRTEWTLNKQAFEHIVKRFGQPEIDLFASRLNAQLDRYVTWLPDPHAESVDAFTLDWSSFQFYAFPPFCLIPRCLQKIIHDQATGLLVVPNWPTQAWFPCLKAMLVEEPMLIPKSKDLLLQPVTHAPHPLYDRLDILCCRLSGKPSSQED